MEDSARSRWIDLGGPVHYLDFGGPAGAPVIVAVHGLSGAAVNWAAVAPLLTGTHRLLAPDLAGHGLTPSAGRGASVARNRDLLHRFIEAVPGAPVLLMGNSMGGMISLLEATASPGSVAGLILIDPALPFMPVPADLGITALFVMQATPGLNRMLAGRRRQLSPEELVTGTLWLCCVDPGRVPADVLAEHVEVARLRTALPGAEQDFTAALRSVVGTAGYLRGFGYRRGLRSVACPVLLIHGERDRLVPVAAARAAARAHPAWSLVVLPDTGHVPQLEAPAQTAAAVTSWLGSAGRAAAELATPGTRPGICPPGPPSPPGPAGEAGPAAKVPGGQA